MHDDTTMDHGQADGGLTDEQPKQSKPNGHASMTVLDKMVAKYFVVMIKSKVAIVSWGRGPLGDEIKIQSTEAFKFFHSDKKVTWKDKADKEHESDIFDLFKQRATRYEGLVYEPDHGLTVNNCLNMWRGLGIKPKSGDWHLMRAHIRDVLANGDPVVDEYIVKWAAWAVQNPGRQAEVALVFLGGQGSGRGIFGRAMCNLFNPHSVHISNSRALTGDFSGHLMHASFLFVDEAFWAGSKEGLGQLKRMITEDTLLIELKHIDAFSVKNCLHMIIASNENWVVPAGIDERRFMVARVSEHHKQSPEYFKPLYDEMNGGGLEAMLHDLKEMDLKGWHPRLDVPQTEALMQQKLISAEGVNRAILVLAEEGVLPNQVDGKPNVASTSGERSGSGFWGSIRNLSHSLKTDNAKTMMPILKDWGCKRFKSGNVRGVEFPALADLRRSIDKRYGAQDWDLDDEWQPSNQNRFNRDA